MNRRFRIGSAVLACCALTSAACGSRLEQAELESANGAFQRVAEVGSTQPGDGGSAFTFEDVAGDTAPVEAGSAPAAGTGSAVSSAVGSSGSDPAARSSDRPAAAASPGARAGSDSPGATSVTPRDAAAATPGAPVPGTPQPATPAPGAGKSEILLGSFGAESGILGAVSGPAPPAIRAWASYVNAGGGINGHPVRVILGDDNANPSRSQAIVRQMVEQDGVIAFFNDYSFTLPAVMPYLEQKKIPIIGSIGGDAIGDHSPMMFNPMVGPDVGQAWGFILNVLVSAPGKKKVGIVYCREATTCSVQKDSFKRLLPYKGLEVVYEAFVSLAQPDYTGEMLQAQRAGAEVILPLIDTAALNRLVLAAKRQNYEPVFAGTYNLNQDLIYAYAENLDGVAVNSRVGAWDTSPRLQFYRDAMARYQPRAPMGDLGAGVFATGKLLQERIGPYIDEPPTTAQILEGLYSLEDEKLGGLFPGIGFRRDAEHVDTNQCVIPTLFTGGRFVPHDEAESFVCAPDWKPVGT